MEGIPWIYYWGLEKILVCSVVLVMINSWIMVSMCGSVDRSNWDGHIKMSWVDLHTQEEHVGILGCPSVVPQQTICTVKYAPKLTTFLSHKWQQSNFLEWHHYLQSYSFVQKLDHTTTKIKFNGREYIWLLPWKWAFLLHIYWKSQWNLWDHCNWLVLHLVISKWLFRWEKSKGTNPNG